MLPIKNKVAVLFTLPFDFSLVNSSDDINFIDCVLIAKSYQSLISMSIEKEVEIYTYTVNILNLSLKIKFPCKIHL